MLYAAEIQEKDGGWRLVGRLGAVVAVDGESLIISTPSGPMSADAACELIGLLKDAIALADGAAEQRRRATEPSPESA